MKQLIVHPTDTEDDVQVKIVDLYYELLVECALVPLDEVDGAGTDAFVLWSELHWEMGLYLLLPRADGLNISSGSKVSQQMLDLVLAEYNRHIRTIERWTEVWKDDGYPYTFVCPWCGHNLVPTGYFSGHFVRYNYFLCLYCMSAFAKQSRYVHTGETSGSLDEWPKGEWQDGPIVKIREPNFFMGIE